MSSFKQIILNVDATGLSYCYHDCAFSLGAVLSRRGVGADNTGTKTLLEHYWKAYPQSKVMQCGYDIPCEQGGCLHTDDSRIPFCKSNATCMDEVTLHWQGVYVDALDAHYNQPGGVPGGGSYDGLNILGTVQVAGGVKGAAVGYPVLGVGSPCDLETMCVHPTHGKAGATAVGEAFWELYYSKRLPLA